MPEIDPVILRLIAEDQQYKRTLANVQTVTEQRLGAVEKSSVTMASTMTRSFAAARAAALSLLAGVSVITFAKTLVTIGDEAKKLDAQLRLATQGFGTFAQAQEDVQRIAEATRSDIGATVSLYANFVRGAKELGATQAEAARATETFSKSLKISGADANQAASATLQFGQALAAGALRGDELNSILEASPRLARLLAESMGKPIGEIKKLGEAGALTSDKLLAALTDKKFTAGIDAEFRMVPLTVDDAMTKVRNSTMAVFSAFDRGGEFSSMLAAFIADGVDGFDTFVESAENAGIEVRSIMEGLGTAFEPLKNAGGAVFDVLIGQTKGWGEAFSDEIRNSLAELDFLSAKLAKIPNYWNTFANSWDSLVNGVHGTNRPMRDMAQGGSMVEDFDRARASRRRALRSEAETRRYDALLGGFDALGNPIAGTKPGGTVKRTTPSGKTPKAAKVAKSPLDADAFAREEASLNDRILSLKADAVVDAGARAKIELDRLSAQRDAAVVSIEADKRFTDEQKKRVVALTESVIGLEQAKVIQKRDADLAQQSLDARRENDRYEHDALQASADLADTRKDSLAAERRIRDFMEQREQAELDALVAAGKVADAKQAQADLEAMQAGRRGRTDRDHESPLARRQRDLDNVNIDDEKQQIAIDAMDRFADSTANAAAEYLKLGGIAGDVINGIIQDLVRLAVQQTIVKPLMNAVGGFFGVGNLASGTDFAHGGAYRVGEAGPETVILPQGAKVIPNTRTAAAGGGQAPVQIVVRVDKSPYFDATVDQRATNVAAPMAVASGLESSRMTQQNIARRSRNRIP